VVKIVPVLDLFTAERPEWGASEVADALSIPKSSAHALLVTLSEIGLLQLRSRGRYCLGWKLLELGETVRVNLNRGVRKHARPVMEKLVKTYGETMHLAVLDRTDAIYVDKIVGSQVVTITGTRPGARLAAHAPAVGKVLLAYSYDVETLSKLLTGPLPAFTNATITDPEVLLRELTQVRVSGIATERGEVVPDVCCVAAPIADESGRVVAAMSFTVPSSRFNARRLEYEKAIVRACTQASRALAGSAPEGATTVFGDTAGVGVIR
jgi:DNA-binding IclR family transcriptional regulator